MVQKFRLQITLSEKLAIEYDYFCNNVLLMSPNVRAHQLIAEDLQKLKERNKEIEVPEDHNFTPLRGDSRTLVHKVVKKKPRTR